MRYTVVSNSNGILAKTIKSDGTKESSAHLTQGIFTTQEVDSLLEFDKALDKLKPKQAIVLGLSEYEDGYIATQNNLSSMKSKHSEYEVITRSKEYFEFDNEAIILFDIDADDGDNVDCHSYEDIKNIMNQLDPQFEDAEILIRHSSSSHIYKWEKGSKVLTNGAGSYHIYIRMVNVDSLSSYIKSLEQRAWMLGYGYIKVSKAGSLLERQVFDSAVFSPERLVFEAAVVCEDPYEQEKPQSFYQEGGVVDCNIELDINVEEVTAQIQMAKDKVSDVAQEIKSKFIDSYATKFITDGYSKKEATEKANQIASSKKLFSINEITLANQTTITVKDIFLNPDEYNSKSCHDPIEGEKGIKAIIYSNNGIKPIIHSFVHGGTNYELIVDEKIIQEIIDEYILVNHTMVENNKFIYKIKQMVHSIKINDSKISDMARELKSHKILSAINGLSLTATEKQEIAEEQGYVDFCPKGNVLDTVNNLKILMKNSNIDFEYDVVLKDFNITHHTLNPNAPSKEAAVTSLIEREAGVLGIKTTIVNHMVAITNSQYSNPLMDSIKEYHKKYTAYDMKTNYVMQVVNTLNSDRTTSQYTEAILTKWLIQCIAAWDYERTSTAVGHKDKYESVLILQGEQGLRKSDFFAGLLPKNQRQYIKDGANLNLQDKDSIIQNTAYGIVELGEIERTFNKSGSGDIKAFLSNSYDEYRVPYGKTASKVKRTTSFCGSVNQSDFLKDPTGARRFWILPLSKIDFIEYEKIDKEMLWAQVYDLYLNGATWWFDETDSAMNIELEKLHSFHKEITPANEVYEILKKNNTKKKWLSASEIFTKVLPDKTVTKNDVNELATILDAHGIQRNSAKKFKVAVSKTTPLMPRRKTPILGIYVATIKGISTYWKK